MLEGRVREGIYMHFLLFTSIRVTLLLKISTLLTLLLPCPPQIFKQMRILYGSEKTNEELLHFRDIVRTNCLTLIVVLCTFVQDKLDLTNLLSRQERKAHNEMCDAFDTYKDSAEQSNALRSVRCLDFRVLSGDYHLIVVTKTCEDFQFTLTLFLLAPLFHSSLHYSPSHPLIPQLHSVSSPYKDTLEFGGVPGRAQAKGRDQRH